MERFDREQREKRFESYAADLLDFWLSAKRYGTPLEEVLAKKGIHTVAIYGLNRFGIRLYHELKDSPVAVLYAIEPDRKRRIPELPAYEDESSPPEKPDAVIVAEIQEYHSVAPALERAGYRNLIAFDALLFQLMPGGDTE